MLIELHYFPSIAWVHHFLTSDHPTLEAHERFQKQSHRNRCYVLGANKIEMLSVPITKATKRNIITEVEIDYSKPWVAEHLHTMRSAYGKAAFYDYYSDQFQEILNSKPATLWQLNESILKATLTALGVKKEYSLSQEWTKIPQNGQIDMRSVLNSSTINDKLSFYPYTQNFGNNFAENLSILDLIFCMGPESLYVLSQTSYK